MLQVIDMGASEGTSAAGKLRLEIERLQTDLAHLRREICVEADELLASWLPLVNAPAFKGQGNRLNNSVTNGPSAESLDHH